jgi:hypothetical protein
VILHNLVLLIILVNWTTILSLTGNLPSSKTTIKC